MPGWGSEIVDRLVADLPAKFPDAVGFSSANLRYMKSFAEAWPDPASLQRLVGKLPYRDRYAPKFISAWQTPFSPARLPLPQQTSLV